MFTIKKEHVHTVVIYIPNAKFEVVSLPSLACEAQTYSRSSLVSLRKATTGNTFAVRRLFPHLLKQRNRYGLHSRPILWVSCAGADRGPAARELKNSERNVKTMTKIRGHFIFFPQPPLRMAVFQTGEFGFFFKEPTNLDSSDFSFRRAPTKKLGVGVKN